jgi:hypothetical protein
MIVSSNKKEGRLNGFLDILRCPRSGQPFFTEGEALTTEDRRQRYGSSPTGIVMFASWLTSTWRGLISHSHPSLELPFVLLDDSELLRWAGGFDFLICQTVAASPEPGELPV